MDAEKIGKLIKSIRKENNLTQKEFASIYNVTYQAVSNWEQGKNIPDIALLKQICEDYHISLDNLLNGDKKAKKDNKIFIIIFVILIILIVILLFIFKDDNFEFKTLTSSCDSFNITGSITYNNKKTAIYISSIDYCGEEVDTIYTSIECSLYENYNNTNTLISKYLVDDVSDTLKNLVIDVYFVVDAYEQVCKKYSDKSLFIEINATTEDGIIHTFSIPLSLIDTCSS